MRGKSNEYSRPYRHGYCEGNLPARILLAAAPRGEFNDDRFSVIDRERRRDADAALTLRLASIYVLE